MRGSGLSCPGGQDQAQIVAPANGGRLTACLPARGYLARDRAGLGSVRGLSRCALTTQRKPSGARREAMSWCARWGPM